MRTRKKLKLKKEVKSLIKEIARDILLIGLVGLWSVNLLHLETINGNFILSYLIGYAIIKLAKTYF